MAYLIENIYFLALYRKCLPNPALKFPKTVTSKVQNGGWSLKSGPCFRGDGETMRASCFWCQPSKGEPRGILPGELLR